MAGEGDLLAGVHPAAVGLHAGEWVKHGWGFRRQEFANGSLADRHINAQVAGYAAGNLQPGFV